MAVGDEHTMLEQCDLYPQFVESYAVGAERLDYTVVPARDRLDAFYYTIGMVCARCHIRTLCRPNPTSIGILTQFNFSDE